MNQNKPTPTRVVEGLPDDPVVIAYVDEHGQTRYRDGTREEAEALKAAAECVNEEHYDRPNPEKTIRD